MFSFIPYRNQFLDHVFDYSHWYVDQLNSLDVYWNDADLMLSFSQVKNREYF